MNYSEKALKSPIITTDYGTQGGTEWWPMLSAAWSGKGQPGSIVSAVAIEEL